MTSRQRGERVRVDRDKQDRKQNAGYFIITANSDIDTTI